MISVIRSGVDPAAHAADIERDLAATARTAGRTIGKQARAEVLADVRAARGSLRMFTGRLGVTVVVDATAAGSIVTLRPTPAGGWAIIERGARAHTITARRARVLASGATVYGTRVEHPGTRGGRYWTRATDRLADRLDPAVAREFDEVITA